MKVGKRLKQLISEQGKTPSEVARLANVRPQRLSDWLADASVRDIRQLKSVCKVLNISLDDLLFPNEQDNSDQILSDKWLSGKFEIKIRRIK